MNKQQVVEFLESKGYTQNTRSVALYDHPTSDKSRFRFSRLVVRHEQRAANNVWYRMRSAYYKNISINSDTGKLTGFNR